MPKRTDSELPASLAFDAIKGEEFTQIRTAARLSGIHPDILTAGRKLLAGPEHGFVFRLQTAQMQQHGAAMETLFSKGLRKVAKAFGGKGKMKTYLDRDNKRIVCWYDVRA